MSLEIVNGMIRRCHRCNAGAEANRPVCGMGPEDARVMVVGRNPGLEEDMAGVPFIGRAGNMLNDFLETAGLDRDEIYVTNLIKCYTKDNRPPVNDEVESCMDFLVAEIKSVCPEYLLIFGSQAFDAITGKRVGPCRKRLFKYTDSRLIPPLTYAGFWHPGAGFYNQQRRKEFMDDAEWLKNELNYKRSIIEIDMECELDDALL